MKKKIAAVISFIFSITSFAFAGNPVKGASKKWDPTDKPTALYNKQGHKVNMNDLNIFKGKILYDKNGNAFSIQDDKIIRMASDKKVDKRVKPAPIM